MTSYKELGVYSVAVSLAGIGTLLAGIFNTIWAPLVYRWVKEGRADYTKIDNISEYVLAATYFSIVFSGLFAWTIQYFLPPQYKEVQVLLPLCLIAPLFYTLSETTSVGIAIKRKTKYSMYASIVTMIIALLGNYILIPRFGAVGAAISLSISFWVFFILRTEYSKMIWREIPVNKSYIVSFFILMLAIVNVFISLENLYRYLIWLIAFFLGLYIFKNLNLRSLKI